MENAVDALKMGFAVLVFIAALSLAVFSFTRVRETSARITQEADIVEYYQQLSLGSTGATSNNALSSRIVGVETVIPTLYRYYKENYTILFYVGRDYNRENGTFGQIDPMPIYYTETNSSYLNESTLTTANNSRAIYGFDIQDEQIRREPWSANQETSYNFIEAFVNGLNSENYYTSRTASLTGRNVFNNDNNGLGPYYQIDFTFHEGGYNSGGLIGKDYEFVERYGEYNYENISNSALEDENLVQYYNILSNVTSSVDIYDNGEAIENNRGTTKRIIQYIYIASEV